MVGVYCVIKESMENKRPRLDDPKEFAIIRQMYLGDRDSINNDLDPIERLERQEAKYRNNNKTSR